MTDLKILMQTENDGKLEFFTRNSHVRVGRVNGHSMPICEDGLWQGQAISASICATGEILAAVARRWYEQYLENHVEGSVRSIDNYIGPDDDQA